MQNKIITVRVRNVFGNDNIYPVCDAAKNLIAILGQKLWTTEDIKNLKKLGYTLITEEKTIIL